MKPLRIRLLESQKQLGTPWQVLERDYLLSWILASIAQTEQIKEKLVFKGGTALKKCYFGNYRFSEDLDFTCLGSIPKDVDNIMQQVCKQAIRLISPYNPIDIICEQYQKDSPHPRGQVAYNIRAQFSWHRKPLTNVMVEITADEQLIKPAILRPILHDYGESISAKISTYSLEEIVAEKLRAILQNTKTLEQKGWVRSRARDYYDLWRILSEYKDELDTTDFKILLDQKCAVREVSYAGYESFFSPALQEIVEKSWAQWLEPLLPLLPEYKTVISDLKKQIKSLLQ